MFTGGKVQLEVLYGRVTIMAVIKTTTPKGTRCLLLPRCLCRPILLPSPPPPTPPPLDTCSLISILDTTAFQPVQMHILEPDGKVLRYV